MSSVPPRTPSLNFAVALRWGTNRIILVIALATFMGCSSRSDLADVEGIVTYQGQLLKSGTIIFEVTGARSAFGEIEEGKIVNVTTFERGDGAPVGNARVAITSVENISPPPPPEENASQEAPGGMHGMPLGRNAIPQHYANPATSELTVSIEPGENDFMFELK